MNNSPPLEPRVAKLEASVDRISEDIRSLAAVVRDQGNQTSDQIKQLSVAVTQAQAPRKTDWNVVISGVLLVMALGSAVFWPLNQQAQNNKEAIDKLTVKYEQQVYDTHKQDADELRLWRQKAEGLVPNQNQDHYGNYDDHE